MLLYRTILLLLTPLLLLHLAWRAVQCGEWRYFAQRIGFDYDAVPNRATWVHCASVGEVKSVLPLLEELHRKQPAACFIITSNTATSRRIVLQQGCDWLTHQYCPIDWLLAVKRFIRHAAPERCYVFETELWPNMFVACKAAGIPISIINGRISDTTMRRAGILRHIYRPLFGCVQNIYARNDIDQQRFIELGADAERTISAGDLKLVRTSQTHSSPQQLTTRSYILAVSTHDDEELQIARRYNSLPGEHLLVIAPRHPERGGAVASQLHNEGFNIAMHSTHDVIGNDTDIYILDAIGLLDEWYPDAVCVIMGGSFADIGGHNLVEPLAFSRAVVYGPHMHNFLEMNAVVRQHDAAAQVQDYEEMATQIRRWLDNNELRKQQQQRATELTTSLKATLQDYIELIETQLAAQPAE